MRISFEITRERIWWTVVGVILIAVLALLIGVSTASDKTGAGYFVMGIVFIAAEHFYLLIIPILVMGFGVAHDVKRGRSTMSSIISWFCAGIAIYFVAICAVILFLVR